MVLCCENCSLLFSFRGFGPNPEGNYLIELKGPVLTLVGPYEISGRILILPIQGSGRSNITISK